MDPKIKNSKSIGNPVWLLAAITIPQSILYLLFAKVFLTAYSVIDDNERKLWEISGLILGVLILIFSIYSVIMIIRKKGIHIIMPILITVLYIGYLYFLGLNFNLIFSSSIPSYIISQQKALLYIGTFIIPCLFYSILLFIDLLGKYFSKQRILPNFVTSVIISVSWYFLYNLLLHNSNIYYSKISIHAVIFLLIIMTVCFYFSLIRGIYLLFKKRREVVKKFDILWKILFAIVFPFMGLLLNEMYFPFDLLKKKMFLSDFHGIFGDFSSPVFFVLVIVNGLMLIMPDFKIKHLRFILFIFRSVLFSFTFYFFILFLPFYPFFAFALIIFGAGFLIISPLILFIIHTRTLYNDLIYLSGFIKPALNITVMSVSLFVIPLVFVSSFLTEKKNLFKALEYVYNSNIHGEKNLRIDFPLLKRSLYNIERNKVNDSFLSGNRIPYITPLYNFVVLDNLTLSDDRILMMKKIFFDENPVKTTIRKKDSDVMIKKINYKSAYDLNSELYYTDVDLDIKNYKGWTNEFAADLELPEGVWIDGFYLNTNGKKVKGILTEKKTTLWIYQEIINTRRDPGLIYYKNKNTITFRIFPFAGNESRKTGFSLASIEPLKIKQNGNELNIIVSPVLKNMVITADGSMAYIPEALKKSLKPKAMKSYYYFIMDCSSKAEFEKNKLVIAMERFIEKNKISRSKIRLTLCDFNTESMIYNNDISSRIMEHKNTGGFFLDRALKEIYSSYSSDENAEYPVPIIISSHPELAVLDKSTAEFAFNFFYTENLYFLDQSLLFEISIDDFIDGNNEKFVKIENIPDQFFLSLNFNGRDCFIPEKKHPSVYFSPGKFKYDQVSVKNARYLLSLSALYKYGLFDNNNQDKNWKELYFSSIKLNVLCPYTCFTVLENEIQYKVLLEKQKDIINNKIFLDKSSNDIDEVRQMPEPSIAIIFIIALILISLHIIRKRKHQLLKK
jgi:hypothetical protein